MPMASSSHDIYFHMPSGNQTKLWPVEKYWLESFIMSVPSAFLINSFSSLLLITYQVFYYWPQVAVLQQETALSEAKTKVSHWCGLNYSLLSFKIYWYLPPDFMPEHRLQNCRQRMPWKLCVDFKRATLEISSKAAGRVKHNKTTGLPGKNQR